MVLPRSGACVGLWLDSRAARLLCKAFMMLSVEDGVSSDDVVNQLNLLLRHE